MATSLTHSKLINLLQIISKGEQEIEQARLTLALNPSFESYVAFKRIDRHSDNSLSTTEVINFLKDNHIRVYDKELRPLFDIHSNGGIRLSYTDFQKIVLPKTDGLLRHQCLSRKVQALSGDEYLPERIETALANLLYSEINFLQKLENLKEELATRHDIGLMDTFQLIDEEQRGSLDFTSLYNFLEKHTRVTKSDVEALLTRFDKNRDQELSYNEFVRVLQPLNPHYRVAVNSPCKKSRASSPRASSPRISSPRRKEANPYHAESYRTPVKGKRVIEEEKDYLRETARTDVESKGSLRSPSFYNTSSSLFKESPNKGDFVRDDISPIKATKVTSFEESSPLKTLGSPASLGREEWMTYRSPVKERSDKDQSGFLALDYKEKRELARFLKDTLDLDKAEEKIKKELAEQRKFNSKRIFAVFDSEGKGYVTKGQLESGLKEFNIFPSKNELYLLMRKFDKNNDGLIRFGEFKEEVEPRQNEHKSLFDGENKEEEIGHEVRRLMRKLLNKMINNEVSCEELRRSLNKKMHFSVFEAFKNLQKNYRDWVTATTFKDLLNDQEIFASIEDADLLMVRFDRNKNGRVSYSEFVDEMMQRTPLAEDKKPEEQATEEL